MEVNLHRLELAGRRHRPERYERPLSWYCCLWWRQLDRQRGGAAPAGRVLSAYARKWRGHDSGNCDHRRQNKLELRWLSQRHGLIPSVLIDLPGLTTRRARHRVTIATKLHGRRVTPLGKYSQMCVHQWTHATESLFTSVSHAWTVEPYASITQPSSREAARAFLRALAY